MKRLRAHLHELYFKNTPRALRFRSVLLVFDLVIIGFFIIAPFVREHRFFLWADYSIALILAIDLAARAWGHGHFWRWLRQPIAVVDIIVLLSMLFPYALANLGVLRILRAWTLVHSDKFWMALRRGKYDDTYVEDVVKSSTTLFVFVFIMTGFVHSGFAGQHPGMNSYVDSLYFTIMTLTTTGFGDIVLEGTGGRLLSILIMIGGVTLFVRLAQAILKPHKVVFPCPTCGLRRHDPDAVHCKLCATPLNIPYDG